MRLVLDWLRANVDKRDVLAAAGLLLLVLGGERLYPGAGLAAAGAVLVAIAALGVR